MTPYSPDELEEIIGRELLNDNLYFMSKNQYSILKGIGKGLLAIFLFSVPVVIDQFPQFFNLTIGGLLVVAANYLKFKYKSV